MIEKIIAIAFSLMIFGQAWGVRRVVRTWIFPACLFGLFWFVYTIIPLLALPAAPVEPLSIFYILICCIAYSVSAFSFDWKRAFAVNKSRIHDMNYGSIFLRRLFYVLSSFALIGVVVNWFLQGITLSQIIFSLKETSNEYMARRYSDSLSSNIYGQIGVVLTYVSAIIGGIVFWADRKRHRNLHIAILSLLPAILVMLVEAAKGTFFLVLAFFLGGILSSKISQADLRFFEGRVIFKLFLWSTLLLPIVVFSFMARGIDHTEDVYIILGALERYFVSYTSGHLYAFSDWFSNLTCALSDIHYDDEFGAGGFYTFMAIFKMFGSSRYVPPGVYEEYFSFEDILTSNIYTMFRGLIVDFGVVGSIVFMLAFGLFSHLIFFSQLTVRRPYLSTAFFPHLIGFFYTSFIISLLIWNSIYASFFAVAFILFVNDRMAWRDGVSGGER